MSRKMSKVVGKRLEKEIVDGGWKTKYQRETGAYYKIHTEYERAVWVAVLDCGHTSESAINHKTLELTKKRMFCYWCDNEEDTKSMRAQGRILV